MEHMFKKILSFSLLACTGMALADCNDCNSSCNNNSNCCEPVRTVTCFQPRSQSFNNVIKDAGLDPDNQFIFDVDGFNGTFKLNFEYDHTFDADDLGQCLFGPAAVCVPGCNDDAVSIKIVGSAASTVPNGTSDLVADNFFLPKDFSSVVTIEPSIQNYNIHLQAYFGFDEWCTGLYLRVYAPITVSRWKLETKETITAPGVVGYAAGEIAPVAVLATPTSQLYTSFLSYTQGTALTLPGSTTPTVVAGPTVQALKYTRFGGGCDCNDDTTTQLADLRAEFGWNFLLDEDYHLGIYIAAAAPTADDCEGDCDTLLWGAKAGNGKHWELGGGITGHYTLWRSEDCEQQFDFFVDATINHMFKHTETRTFDLVGQPLSRYLIAEQLTTATTGLTVGGTAATYQFAGTYAPVANFTTLPISISFPVQADVLAKFVYTCRGFSWAIGYDFWGQTCPNIDNNNSDCNDDCNAVTFPANTWALRGDAHVYGFRADTTAAQAIPATDSSTSVFTVSTAFESTSGTVPVANTNQGVDNPGLAAISGVPLTVAPAGIPQINGSNPPVFITANDIDYCSVTRGMSNSVFTELNYTWIDRECWVPYLGIGAKVEFGSNSGDDCCNVNNTTTTTTTTTTTSTNGSNLCCDNCGTCSATKWAIWIQGGLSFN